MATDVRWKCRIELDETEREIAGCLKRTGKFFVFLREIRHELFDEAFQTELAQAYEPRGSEPLPAGLLAMVTLLQAYTQTGDAEAVVAAKLDQRWQLVLGGIGKRSAPFSQGVLSQFRERMIEHDLDQKLLDRTVELAKQTGKFGWQHLRATLDSSPLLGAGRVLDTWNLIGAALSTVVTCAAKVTGCTRDDIIAEAKLTFLSAPSLKAALDIDWDDAEARGAALATLLGEVEAVERWVANHASEPAKELPLREALARLRQVLAQDLEPDPTTGRTRIRRGVAKDRMPSLGDPEMRHGRKSKHRRFNGYKRHVMQVDGGVVVGAEVLPANSPEQDALPRLLEPLRRHGELRELGMDRGYLGSEEISTLRTDGVSIHCRPWPSRNRGRFTKEQFEIRLEEGLVRCPQGAEARITGDKGLSAHFGEQVCAPCPRRGECTASKDGRRISIHPQEALLVDLRQAVRTKEGRARLRERVVIEHQLARIGQIQGARARYKGARKNTLDCRRASAISNLQVVDAIRRAA